MTRRSKMIERWRQNPNGVRFEEVDGLLLYLGFSKRQSGTSHATYSLDAHIIVIPFKRPFIRSVYVKNLLDLLDELPEVGD